MVRKPWDKGGDICGQNEVPEAILTCTQCKVHREHKYCARVPLEESVTDWICGECESKRKAIRKTSPLLGQGSKSKSVKVGKSHELPAQSKKNHNWERKVQTGKTKYLSVDEAIKLSSGQTSYAASALHPKPKPPKIVSAGQTSYVTSTLHPKPKPPKIVSSGQTSNVTSTLHPKPKPPKIVSSGQASNVTSTLHPKPKPPNIGNNEISAIKRKTGSTKPAVPVSRARQSTPKNRDEQKELPRDTTPKNRDVQKELPRDTTPKNRDEQKELPRDKNPKNRDEQKELPRDIQWAKRKARTVVKKQPCKPNLRPITISGNNTSTAEEQNISDATVLPESEKCSKTPDASVLPESEKCSKTPDATVLPEPERSSWTPDATVFPEQERSSWTSDATVFPEQERSSWTSDATVFPEPERSSWTSDATVFPEPERSSWTPDATDLPEPEKSSWTPDATVLTEPEKSSWTPDATVLPEPERSSPDATVLPEPEKSSWTPDATVLPEPERSSPDATALPEPEKSSWTPDATVLPEPERSSWTPDATVLPEPEKSSWTPAATVLPEPEKSSCTPAATVLPESEKCSKTPDATVLPESEKCSWTPALDALWKGSFNIQEDNLNPKIRAHPPSRVRRKIYEFSMKMPDVLHFQLVSAETCRLDVFKEIIPSQNDVALYFFPSGEERLAEYLSLVESISTRDLALKEQFDDVELFVFTSKCLPVNFQCVNKHYFLWGVFHRPEHVSRSSRALKWLMQSSHNANEGSDGEEIDMEIDMVGGIDQGRVDVPVKRNTI